MNGLRSIAISLVKLVPLQVLLLVCSIQVRSAEYHLNAGDVIEIAISNIPELQRRALINIDGTVSLPLLGTMRVTGFTVHALRERIEAELATKLIRHRSSDGREHVLLIKPGDVTAVIAEYRPIYVHGDVLAPGQFSYRPSLTVRQAVALSGGYSTVRAKMLSSLYDPRELERDQRQLWAEFAGAQVHSLRSKAELDEKNSFERSALEGIPIPDATLDELVRLESESLKISQADFKQDRAVLHRSIKEADELIAVLTEQEQHDARAVQVDSEELKKLNDLLRTGNVQSTRVSESRRAVLLSSTRRLQTAASLLQAKRQRDEAASKLNQAGNQRKLTLLREIKDSDAKLHELRLKLETVAEKLRGLRSTTALKSAESIRPEITIARKSDQISVRISANEDTELSPGDVVEVVIRDDSSAEVNVRKPPLN